MNLTNMLRTSSSTFKYLNSISRGAKRKGEKKEIVHSQHVLNIYKNADDVKVLPNEYYPPWVMNLSRWPTIKEEMWGMYYVGNYVRLV